ncbi:hypothetical protein M2451_002162 [Dysgonomonas sp. PFB1-18]|uniref:hypothetical protein n=1 Tax=unclassified Dysgonomonas TaxID=2630389 RepID=UPI0024764029|nr:MULTISPECIES: hypothetical protein [unclassified Dysgonomonas]MDL2303387.1 hypothetical protein [Dysgonomonas sp. OttesenSCG-928-D17]MDH6309654.1 hypothetical protein [Dysgonomonas sp. PF1-14]MDH6339338.1 hypothetical protein [Dysgonomonas sp. PF1-16]MDH6380837.1 hypothetical protein [Dysgonomonas sp. PFB1-18]MDH6398333.1 hypothetical protein [Dysgonomonas sp. PF1-23]
MQDSFKNRINKFWKSFSEEEAQIREMMDNKVEGETLISFVDSILKIAFHKAYFEMGINKSGKYELILTPEGDRSKLMQLHYWLQYAPEHLWEKWNFYSAKPGMAGDGWAMRMYDTDLSADNIIIYPEIDDDKNKVNIEVYCPKLIALDESKRYSMFFIFLDQYIGEIYTMEYIGYIDFTDTEHNKSSISITNFKSVIDKIIDNNNWQRFENPTEKYSGYRMEPNENEGWKLREDIFSGYTSCTPLLNDYYNEDNSRLEEAKQDGLFYGFLFFENVNIPRENIVNFRGDIEDKIVAQTTPYGIANSLGGATGFHFSYIDFIIYDFEAFLAIAKAVLSGYDFEEKGYSDFTAQAEPILFN